MAVPPPSPITSLSEAIRNLSPLFLGTGTTTGTDTETGIVSGAPLANADLQTIIQQALANSTDPTQTTDLVTNILANAAKAFAPQAAQERAAGLYNSSTLSQLRSQATGEAAAQASKAVLDYKTSQQQIASVASGNLLQGNKTTSSTAAKTATTTPSVDPVNALLAAGGTFAAAKLAKSLGVDKVTDSAGNYLQANLGDPIQNFLGIGPAQAADQAHVLSVASGGSPLASGFVPAAASGSLESAAGGVVDAASLIGQNAEAPLVDTAAAAPVAETAASAAETGTEEAAAEGSGNIFSDLGDFFDNFF